MEVLALAMEDAHIFLPETFLPSWHPMQRPGISNIRIKARATGGVL